MVGLPNQAGGGGKARNRNFETGDSSPAPFLPTLPYLAPSFLVLTPIPPPWHVILLLLMDCRRGGFGPPAVAPRDAAIAALYGALAASDAAAQPAAALALTAAVAAAVVAARCYLYDQGRPADGGPGGQR